MRDREGEAPATTRKPGDLPERSPFPGAGRAFGGGSTAAVTVFRRLQWGRAPPPDITHARRHAGAEPDGGRRRAAGAHAEPDRPRAPCVRSGGWSVTAYPPRRIVCLTEETVETLYLLGAEDRIVGVTGYAVRPPRVRREKPRVGAFTSADLPKILGLAPDLVLTFSDLQADIAAGLIRAGVAVHAFNQRNVAGILAMIRMLGALVDVRDRAEALAAGLERDLAAMAADAPAQRPSVWFEEWDAPLISGVGWVSELIAIAGGHDVFADLGAQPAARDRIVSPEAVVAAAPEVILASWCGKRVRPEGIAARPGWDGVPAVRAGRIHEIKSPLILAPGPAALTDGLAAIRGALTAGAAS